MHKISRYIRGLIDKMVHGNADKRPSCDAIYKNILNWQFDDGDLKIIHDNLPGYNQYDFIKFCYFFKNVHVNFDQDKDT